MPSSSSTDPARIHPNPGRSTDPPDPPLTLLHPTVSPAQVDRQPHPRPHSHSQPPSEPQFDVRDSTRTSLRQSQRKKGPIWKRLVKGIGSGMRNDVRNRAPYYWSDWTDAWNYRVVPATWFIFFANVLPGLAFSLDLIEGTGQYGVQEVLLASFMAAFVASFLGGQPLLISGVTGPISVFNKTIYDIIETQPDAPPYLHFIGWVYLWAAIMHWVAALFNAVKGLKWVTRFSCDTFGFYVAAVYVQFGIQVVTRQFSQTSIASGFLGIIVAILTLVTPHYFNAIAGSGYGNRHIRRFCSDYGMPLTIIAMTGLAYWGRFNGYVREGDMTLPTTANSFRTATGRDWLVPFWQLEGKWVGIAFPFGFVLFILFYFDANVSSLIAQGSEYPLRKPPGFHWDFFLLGITTFIAGLLGTPAPNGLIPQAPLHTASLVVLGYEDMEEDSEKTITDETPIPASAAPRGTSGARVEDNAIELSSAEEGHSSHRAQSSAGATGYEATGAGPLHRNRSRQAVEGVKRTLSIDAESRKRKRAMSETRRNQREVPIAVVEQRVSNLAQGCLCLILMTAPFEVVLGLIPKGVMAGLFWYMGTDALLTSGVTAKMLYLIRDPRAISPTDPLRKVRKSRIALFTLVELLGFGATFAITQTIAAIGFPIIIMLLVPIRVWLVPRLPFTKEELDVLDGPVASAFTLESVGGSM